MSPYKAGAKRAEICADPHAGGTTPSYGLIEQIIETVPIDIAVMIRPRGGDFVYGPEELGIMKRDIVMAARLGVKCVVFGVLHKNGHLNVEAMQRLVDTAKSNDLETTCHRAFDVAHDPLGFASDLVKLGVDRLLTSGQEATAIEGLGLIRKLQAEFGSDLIIMPGVDINAANVGIILESGVAEVHVRNTSSTRSRMVRSSDLKMGVPTYDEHMLSVVSETKTAKIVSVVAEMARNA